MKKIWFMLLLICGACAFTACSDDENDLPLSERITGIDMPKEIVLGEKAEIKAKGFMTTAKLALENRAQGTVALKDAVFTETAVTFTVPADIIIETYSVILSQDGETFNMGELKVVDKPNPVKDLEVPEKMSLGDDIVIKGKGFNETTEFIFKNEENSFEIKPQVSENEATFILPIDKPTGNYTLVLSQNDWKWELKDIEILEKITSLQMPTIIGIGKKVEIFGEGFKSENFQLILQEIDSEKQFIPNDVIFTETGVSFTVPSDLTQGGSYNVILIYGENSEKEWLLGKVEALNQNKRMTKITFSNKIEEDGYESKEEWNLQYDDNNHLYQIIWNFDGEELTYKIEYADSKITIVSDYENFTYTLDGNRVAKSVDEDQEFSYTWSYNDNYLSEVVDDEGEGSFYEWDEDKNLVSVAYLEVAFSNSTQNNRLAIADPVGCIYKFIVQAMDNNQFFPFLLGVCGNHSVNLPTSTSIGEGEFADLKYEYNEEGYTTSVTTSSYGETKTLVFEYEDYYE